MFIDFDKVFLNENKLNHVPKEVIDVLTEKLPEGFKYETLKDGVLALNPTTPETKIGGIKIDYTDAVFEGFLPKNDSEALEFLYRAQKELQIKLNGEDGLYINGEFFSMSEVIKLPLVENIEGEHLIKIIPQPFNPPFELKLEIGNISEILMVQRVPLADMNKVKFESVDEKNFKISYSMDELKMTLNFNFEIQFEKINSTSEMLKALKLYHGCLTGNFKINGKKINKNKFNEEEAKAILNNIETWTKILDLENKLQVQFNPDISLDEEDVLNIEKLYRCLIQDKPYKEFISLNHFTMNNIDNMQQVKDIVGKQGITFTLTNNVEINLMEVQLKLYMVTYLFDLVVSNYVIENEKIKLLTNPAEGKKIYQSVKLYMDSARRDSFDEEVKEYTNADEIKL